MSEREILFRGKRVDNGEWIEGGFVPSLNGKRFYIGNMFECVEIIPETRSEYTGLTDKNGTRIFEGDIVRCKDTLHEVIFCKISGCAFFGITMPDRGEIWNFDGITRADRMEVIGNIHDNPELLEGD